MAALVVVLGHVLPAVPELSGRNRGEFHATGWAWWVTNTPVQAVWDGGDAVFVFFVLSGFVLVVGRTRNAAGWLSYYPSRLARLYVPVVASVLIALVLTRISYQWTPVSARSVLRDMALVRGVDGLNPPLWSLRWEVVFSLLLPLYVVVARARPGLWHAKVVLLLAATGIGFHTGHVALVCLPIFALGAVLAVEYERGHVAAGIERLDRSGARALLAAAAVVTVLAFNARALSAAMSQPSRSTQVATSVLEGVGALLVVVFALYARPVRDLLERPFAQWLGSRSFSLYLIHEPILTVFVHLVHEAGHGTVAIVAGVPLSLLAAEVFFRVVERPAHRLSRQIAHCARAQTEHRTSITVSS